MGSRRSFLVTMIAAAAVASTATPADAASSHLVAAWEMNEPAGSRTMADSSGNGLRGAIGGEVGTGVHVRGVAGYRFSKLEPDYPPPHPRHLVTVRDTADLDPGDRDYAVTVRLRTTYQFGNIIQKGQATVNGGNFKLQIPNGIVQCLFRGSDGQVIVSAHRSINDGWWHTVRCDRTESRLTLTVDDSEVAYRSGRTGWIANSWPLSIGGKTSCDQIDVGCDYYAGDIDYVVIDAG